MGSKAFYDDGFLIDLAKDFGYSEFFKKVTGNHLVDSIYILEDSVKRRRIRGTKDDLIKYLQAADELNKRFEKITIEDSTNSLGYDAEDKTHMTASAHK